MKGNLKKAICLFVAVLFLISPVIEVKAVTKNRGMIVNVFDGGNNYSGKYQCRSETYIGKVGVFGKTAKIDFVNNCYQLEPNQERFYRNYARFNVLVCSGNSVKKSYVNLKIGDTFRIPKGKNMRVCIDSRIDSSGWNQFRTQMRSGLLWTHAQYSLKY